MLSLTLNRSQHLFRYAIACCTMLVVAIQPGCDGNKTKDEHGTKFSAAVNSMDQAGNSERLVERRSRLSQFKPRLSDYGLFRSSISDLQPAEGVVEYELNTPLFTDYAQKQRLIKLPPGLSANYTAQGPFDFPVGTIIAKTFYYRADLNDPTSKRHLVETRILEHRDSGWVGIPYVWNEDQADADLAIAGATIEVSWKHTDGETRTNSHSVPNLNDCKRCHTSLVMEPIGPKANNLNRDVRYEHGDQNQLAHWSQIGFLSGAPEPAKIPRLAVWNDESAEIGARARAYLEVNCAHCHSPNGPARNSGLHLNVEETNPYHLGYFKTPVAAGKGTGGRLYGIVPGKPQESILEYRMQTSKPGEIMPEFGKSLVHDEGLALIRRWIASMQ